MVALGGVAVSYERGSPVGFKVYAPMDDAALVNRVEAEPHLQEAPL